MVKIGEVIIIDRETNEIIFSIHVIGQKFYFLKDLLKDLGDIGIMEGEMRIAQ